MLCYVLLDQFVCCLVVFLYAVLCDLVVQQFYMCTVLWAHGVFVCAELRVALMLYPLASLVVEGSALPAR